MAIIWALTAMLCLQVLANFGSLPFASDFMSLQSDAARQIQAEVAATPVPSRGKVMHHWAHTLDSAQIPFLKLIDTTRGTLYHETVSLMSLDKVDWAPLSI